MSGATKLGSLLGALVGATTFAFAQDVDWKMYGFADLGVQSVCFFDAKNVGQTNDGHIRVWTKCLPEKDLDDVDEKSDRVHKLADRSADKIANGYVPPIVVIGRLAFDKVRVVTAYEETADLGDIGPNERMLTEFNCSEKKQRRLSIWTKINSEMVNDNKPGTWEYVAPETNVAYLQRILCR
jgi:hypothetical protein